VRHLRTKRGARLLEGGAVLSEILARPGATHSVFDVLAACVASLAPGPRVALLGFAGGGIVAPLRAMGFDGPLDAVDLSAKGQRIFRGLSSSWCGTVRFSENDAARWLLRNRRRYHVVVEDLSVTRDGGATKPSVSFETLPRLIRARLAPGGLVVVNLLPVPGLAWGRLIDGVCEKNSEACLVTLEEFENRVVVAGRRLPATRRISERLRAALREIDSEMVRGLSVRALDLRGNR
jgi:hypothetical protein